MFHSPFKLFCDDEREAAADEIGEVDEDDDDLASYAARLPTPNVSASSVSSYFCCIALLAIVEEDMFFSSSCVMCVLNNYYQMFFLFPARLQDFRVNSQVFIYFYFFLKKEENTKI